MSTADARVVEPESPRMLPALDDSNRAYWTGGAEGHLLIGYCTSCERWVHPPVASCPTCQGALESRPVSGRGRVFSFTINVQGFNPEVPPPYNIAIVTLDEQDDLRLPTNIIDCTDDDLSIGMDVSVAFERNGEHFVPVFVPS